RRLRDGRGPAELPARWRLAPVLAAGLAIDAAGQAAGYLLGGGDAVDRLTRFEFGRAEHVTDSDRRALFSGSGAV
ncbi:MAG: hypothetical protein ACREQ9_24660, partial [Candidatus Binatia bacterium]